MKKQLTFLLVPLAFLLVCVAVGSVSYVLQIESFGSLNVKHVAGFTSCLAMLLSFALTLMFLAMRRNKNEFH